jgi:hypothetical protein
MGGSGKFSHGQKRLFLQGCRDIPVEIFQVM